MASGANGNKLHAEKYESLILRRGRNVIWREATSCSCWNLDSGQPSYACEACKGTGYVYEDPIEDVVLLQSITHNKEYQEMSGVFEVGDAVLSVGYRVPGVLPNGNIDMTMKTARLNKLFHVGMHDLITLTDDEYKTSEVLIRGEAIGTRDADTLLNDYVTQVMKVRKWDPETGVCHTYIEGTHFTVEGNHLVWDDTYPSEVPEKGEQYSVLYMHRPTFTIFTNLPTPRHQDKQELPRRVALRYLAGGLRK